MTKKTEFVHLHLHSEYSLLDGAIKLSRLGEAIREMGMPAVALTDHGNLFGAVEFHDRMTYEGVKPIIGMEAYLSPTSMYDKSPELRKRSYSHLTIIAENNEGYRNLCKLSSLAYIEGFYYKPRIDRKILEEYRKGLIIGSACLKGEVAQHLLSGNYDKAKEVVRFYQDLMGKDNFFIELMDHGLASEKEILTKLAELAKETETRVVATNDAHYLRRTEALAHEVLLCLQTQKKLEDEDHMRFETQEFYVKSPEEMAKLFEWIPESLSNTVKIAERCNFKLDENPDFLLPKFPLPKGEESVDSYLSKLANEGLKKKLGRDLNEEEGNRLSHELSIIKRMGFPGYFLIVSELRWWALKNSIPMGPGRGSAAGSLVSYSIGITDINPLQFNISFERFMNPARGEMPDIDIDVCYERRGEVIDHIIEKYGRNSVCQIITFNRMKARMAIRDVARVMGMTYDEGDQLARLVGGAQSADPTIPELLDEVPELAEKAEKNPEVRQLLEHCEVLENLARNSSVHAAGVIIAPSDLKEFVPLFRTKDNEITTQFEKKSAERIGLLKLDVLGLRTVTVIHHAVEMVRKRGITIDLSDLPLDDPDTLQLLSNGETIGVFQLESPGMREALRKIAVNKFDDITVIVAIYRPGSMHMLDLYVRNKHETEGNENFTISYPHPVMKEVLSETYGIMVYQDQVMMIANRFAGLTMAEADMLRYAMSRKNRKMMLEQREKFVNGAVANKIDKKLASDIFDQIEKFAGYGFNKSHSVCYAILAYQTAYLKSHYPAEFMAATLTSEIGKIDRLAGLVEECRRMRIEIQPPSVNNSLVHFGVDEEGSVVYALSAIKNVGEGPAQAIVEERKENRFTDIFDLCDRIDGRSMNKKVLQSLIESGALDCFSSTRGQKMHVFEKALDYGARARRIREAGQMSLFGLNGGDQSLSKPDFPDIEDMSMQEKLNCEKNLLGFYLSGHPLNRFGEELDSLASARVEDITNYVGREILVGGVVADKKIIPTKNGNSIGFITLEGIKRAAEVVIFSDVLEKSGDLFDDGSFILVEGEVSERKGEIRLVVNRAIPLSRARRLLFAGVHLDLYDEHIKSELLDEIVDILKKYPGQGTVTITINHPSDRRINVRSRSLRVFPEDGLLNDLRELLGQENVKMVRGRSR